MSDNPYIVKMSQEIGELNGSLKTYMAAQEKTNAALFKLCDKHDTDIDSLNATKNIWIGMSLVAGGVGSICVTIATKLFKYGAH